MVQIVKGDKLNFIREDIKGADRARRVKQVVVCPINTTFTYMIKKQLIRNSDINIYGINRAELIYGMAPPLLQGKKYHSASA